MSACLKVIKFLLIIDVEKLYGIFVLGKQELAILAVELDLLERLYSSFKTSYNMVC